MYTAGDLRSLFGLENYPGNQVKEPDLAAFSIRVRLHALVVAVGAELYIGLQRTKGKD